MPRLCTLIEINTKHKCFFSLQNHTNYIWMPLHFLSMHRHWTLIEIDTKHKCFFSSQNHTSQIWIDLHFLSMHLFWTRLTFILYFVFST